jgi:hypothetical protein
MITFDELSRTTRLASELQTDAVEAEIIRVRVDKDKHGRTVLKIWFRPDGENDVYITSLPPALVRELAAKAKYYGFNTPEELIGTRWLFKRVSITDYVNNPQFQGYDRMMPIQLICDETWLEKRLNGVDQLTESQVAELRRMCHGDAVMEYLKDKFIAKREKGTVVYYRK